MASYLQTLCLVESFRTSFNDMLSLASVFNGDLRRALLALQVRLEPGSTGLQHLSVPVYEPSVPNIASVPVDVGNDVKSCSKSAEPKETADAMKSSGSQPVDSGDEFVEVWRRKRRALCVVSSDEDSQSLSGEPSSTGPVIGDVKPSSTGPVTGDVSSHQSCEDSSSVIAVVHDCAHSTGSAGSVAEVISDQPAVAVDEPAVAVDDQPAVAVDDQPAVVVDDQPAIAVDEVAVAVDDQPAVAVDAELAPPIHVLDVAAIGGVESLPRSSHIRLQVSLYLFTYENLPLFSDFCNVVFCIMFHVGGHAVRLDSWCFVCLRPPRLPPGVMF